MKIIKIALILIGIIVLVAITTIEKMKNERECFSQRNFDIIAFFHDNNIPIEINDVFYSDILSYKKRPIVLASFLLTKDSFINFTNALKQKSYDGFNTNEFKSNSSADKNIYRILQNSYVLNAHSIYLYDINVDDNHSVVNIKCLIWLSL